MTAREASVATPLILVIDGDPTFREKLCGDLRRAGFHAFGAGHDDALTQIVPRLAPEALVVSTAGAANKRALSLIGELRQHPQTKDLPIAMHGMAALSSDAMDKVNANAIADSYLPWPITVESLAQCMHGLLQQRLAEKSDESLRIGGLRIDRLGYCVTYGSTSIDLSQTMFDLLSFLVAQPERVFTREQIREGVWGKASRISERSVDVYMTRLRHCLGNEARDMIRTVHGVGYKLSPRRAAQPSGDGGVA